MRTEALLETFKQSVFLETYLLILRERHKNRELPEELLVQKECEQKQKKTKILCYFDRVTLQLAVGGLVITLLQFLRT